MATNRDVIEALVRLDGNQDFEKVLAHLERIRADAIETGATAHDLIFIGRAQGIQIALGQFLNLARDARAILGRMV